MRFTELDRFLLCVTLQHVSHVIIRSKLLGLNEKHKFFIEYIILHSNTHDYRDGLCILIYLTDNNHFDPKTFLFKQGRFETSLYSE